MHPVAARGVLAPARIKGLLPWSMLVGRLWVALAAGATAQPYTFTTIAGVAGVSGSADGTNGAAQFYRPSGLAVDGEGNVYVADLLNHTIRRIAPAGPNWVVSTVAGLAGMTGWVDGTNDQARFDHPSAVAIDGTGTLFVTDNFSHTIRKIVPAGTNWIVSTIAGLAWTAGSDDGINSEARFNDPQAVAADGNGRLYVTDRLNYMVRGVSPVGTNWVVSTLAGTAGTYGGFRDGINERAAFNLPFGIAWHSGGNLYVADFGNNAIRQLSSDGPDWVTSTVAGFSGAQGTNDGHARQAMFNGPNGIAVDASGTLYVTDQFSYTIRKLAPDGNSWLISTIGGLAGTPGTNDGVGASARFNWPWGIAVDGNGGLFVADAANHTIRRGTLPRTPSPALQIHLAANQVVVAWSISASNYVLETSPTLGSAASWMALTDGVAVAGDYYLLTNDVVPAAGFFRLRGQQR